MAQLRLRRNQRVQLLRDIDLFRGCSAAELGRISSLTTEHRSEAGAVITKQGEPGLEAFIIVEGEASANRNDQMIARLGPGALFGELALLDGDTRTATVLAETDLRLLVLSRQEFSSLLGAAPSVGRKIIGQLGKRLRKADEMLDAVPSAGTKIGPLSL